MTELETGNHLIRSIAYDRAGLADDDPWVELDYRIVEMRRVYLNSNNKKLEILSLNDFEKGGMFAAGCANKPADVVSYNQNATGMALKAIQTLVNR